MQDEDDEPPEADERPQEIEREYIDDQGRHVVVLKPPKDDPAP